MKLLCLLFASLLVVSACGSGEVTAPAQTPVLPGGSVLAGAGSSERAAGSVRVGAASDLRAVATAIQPALEEACETRITFVFGSSGQLKTQIEAGADFALLLSADRQYPAELDSLRMVVPNGLASYGVGRLVLATRTGLEPVADVPELSRSDIRRIAIANPGHAPYGRAARQALQAAGVFPAVERKLVLGENIRQATEYVSTGNADAGLLALALVSDAGFAWTVVDAGLHLPIEQTGAVIRGTGAELTARCLLQYLLDPPGQAALREFGFEEPAP